MKKKNQEIVKKQLLNKDIKKGNYNPFYYAYLASSAKELLTKNSGDINFIFNDILENIAKNYNFNYFRTIF